MNIQRTNTAVLWQISPSLNYLRVHWANWNHPSLSLQFWSLILICSCSLDAPPLHTFYMQDVRSARVHVCCACLITHIHTLQTYFALGLFKAQNKFRRNLVIPSAVGQPNTNTHTDTNRRQLTLRVLIWQQISIASVYQPQHHSWHNE